MVESVKVKAEDSVFSIKKGTILSDLNPGFKLPHEPFFAVLGEQIVDRKRGRFRFSVDITLKKSRVMGIRKMETWGQKMGSDPIFLR